MLSTTYILTAISVEQKKLGKAFTELKKHIQNIQSEIVAKVQENYFQSFETAIKTFFQIEKRCHERKMEMYVLPAVNLWAQDQDPVLTDLADLRSSSTDLFIEMQKQLNLCFESGLSTVGSICNVMKSYCEIQQTILAKEEKELIPLALQRLPFDVWFSIASQCLSDQTIHKNKPVLQLTMNPTSVTPTKDEVIRYLPKPPAMLEMAQST
jgi:hypothetical protein